MKRARPFILLGFVAIASVAFAALQEPFSLVRTAKVGDEAKYTFTAEMQFGDIKLTVRGKNTEKVTKVGEDGTLTIESTQSDVVVKTPDEEQPIPDEAKATMTYGKDRVITAYSDDQGETDPSSLRLALITSIQAPKESVKVGDTWSSTLKKLSDKTFDVSASYKVLAIEKVGKFETVVIEVDSKESDATEAATAKGKVWLNIADFSTVKEEFMITNAPIAMSPTPVDLKLTSERAD